MLFPYTTLFRSGDQYSDLDQIWEDVRNKVIDVVPRLPEGVIGRAHV